jgi:3-oxoacyl-[acyl-carrier protein] reductase
LKNILIAGGSSGIGRMIALSMVKKGFIVTVIARDVDKLRNLEGEASKFGQLTGFSVDVNNDDELDFFLLKQCPESIDVLINCIGGIYNLFGDFESISIDQWREAFNINMFLPVKIIQALLPNLRKGTEPLVVNISSLAGERPGKFNPHYGASKAAMNYLTRYLAKNLGKYSIRCVAVSPSTLDDETLTNDASDYARKNNELVEDVRKRFVREAKNKNPLNRIGRIEEVVKMVMFLVSGVPSINGTILLMDSGEMA